MNSNFRHCFFTILLTMTSPVIADNIIEIVMETSEGSIEIELYAEQAPITVSNFLRYVDGGYLNGGSFYRTVNDENDNGSPKIEVIQGGVGRAGKTLPAVGHETTEQTGILHTDGVISMARGDVGTASSEFFISIGDNPGLDYGQPRNPDQQGFAAFGRVIGGMDVVRKIGRLPVNTTTGSAYMKGQILSDPVAIVSVSRK